MVDGSPAAHWSAMDDGNKIKSSAIIDDLKSWLDSVKSDDDKSSMIRFEKQYFSKDDSDLRPFDKMRIKQTGRGDWNVMESYPMFPAGTVINVHLNGLGYLTMKFLTDYLITKTQSWMTAKKELKYLEDEKREGKSHYVRNAWFTPPNLPESVQSKTCRRSREITESSQNLDIPKLCYTKTLVDRLKGLRGNYPIMWLGKDENDIPELVFAVGAGAYDAVSLAADTDEENYD